MSVKGRQRRQLRRPRLPLRPLQVPGQLPPLEGARLEARAFAYMVRALNGEVPPCDPDVGAYMAGAIAGKHAGSLCSHGVPLDQATAMAMEWVRETAAAAAATAAALAAAEEQTGDS